MSIQNATGSWSLTQLKLRMFQFLYSTTNTWCGRFQYYVMHISAGLMPFSCFGKIGFGDAKVSLELRTLSKSYLDRKIHLTRLFHGAEPTTLASGLCPQVHMGSHRQNCSLQVLSRI